MNEKEQITQKDFKLGWDNEPPYFPDLGLDEEESDERFEQLMEFLTELDNKAFLKLNHETIPEYDLDYEVMNHIADEYFRLFIKEFLTFNKVHPYHVKQEADSYFFGWTVC